MIPSGRTAGTHPCDGPGGLEPVGYGESKSYSVDEGVLHRVTSREVIDTDVVMTAMRV